MKVAILYLQKIKRAKELLRITEMPVNEVAFEVGFNDPLYFTRIFKKKIGDSMLLSK